MDPISRRKVGSLLDALETLTNCFNLRELEDEIVEILSPHKSETSKKKESFYDAPSTSKYDPGFSFVRHQQNSIPGLSIPEEPTEKPTEKLPDRSGFGDGKFENRIMPGISFGTKEKTVTDAFRTYEFRGRGGSFNTPRRFEKYKPYVKEETTSSSLSSDNRIPKSETDPFTERKVSYPNERDPRSTPKPEDTESRHDRSVDESDRSYSPHRRDSYNSGQQRYFDRGGMSSSNRGFDNRGRGVSSRGGWQDNRGRGFGSNRGYDNRGDGPSGSNRGQDNRGRPFNTYRGPGNRGQGNDHRGGRRGRRRGRMSLEEQERQTKEMDEKKDEVAKKIRERLGLP
ncbi:zinc finger CCCH domain-containing protein 4 [Tetranychus urticae]|uniref:zinc finger CCCH domain-containing protein 4 n=1 Tax=Tetranychus urticae TaxID=32264 RepID=UPI00077BB3E8|nr:zinc finger CCCH domain-containing protein 4 [Tetranychus urticae]